MRNIQATMGKWYGLAVLVAACSLLLLPGCRNLFEPQGGTGTLSLTIDRQGVERTIRPDISLNNFDEFELRLVHQNTGQEITYRWTGDSVTLQLALGIWDLHVTAFMNGGAAAVGYLMGIVVPSGGTVSGNVMLAPIADGRGTFSWEVSFDGDIRTASMEIYGVDGWDYWGTFYLIDNWSGNVITNPGSIDLDAGQYRIFFTLWNNHGESVTVRETLHIYQNMESRFQYTFEAHTTLLRFILDAWDGSSWNFAEREIAAGHFSIVGVNGINDGNFNAIVRWFNYLQYAVGGHPSCCCDLGRLTDAALIGIASEDASFLNANNYRHRGEAELAIIELVQNGNTPWFDWVDGRTLSVGIGSYTVQITFSADINLPPPPQAGDSLADWLAYLRFSAQSGETYNVVISGNENISPLQAALPTGRSDITINISGSMPSTVSLASSGSLFTIGSGITLVLGNNVILQGMSGNHSPLVQVNSGGNLIMNAGSGITGNASNNWNGGGVLLSGGTFTMNAGTISNNFAGEGGGVFVDSWGTFNMEGGIISGNTSLWGPGGGVRNWGTFNMRGGTISGNTVNCCCGGGGVFNQGTFQMSGGVIYGNDDAEGNTATQGNGAALSDCCCATAAQFGTFIGNTFTPSGWLSTTDYTIEVVNGVLLRPGSYTITFLAGGAVGTPPATISGFSGSVITIPGQAWLNMPGHAFAGWFDGVTTHTAGNAFTITADVTMTAQWEYVGVGPTRERSILVRTNDFWVGLDINSGGLQVGDTITVSGVSAGANQMLLNMYHPNWRPLGNDVQTIGAGDTFHFSHTLTTADMAYILAPTNLPPSIRIRGNQPGAVFVLNEITVSRGGAHLFDLATDPHIQTLPLGVTDRYWILESPWLTAAGGHWAVEFEIVPHGHIPSLPITITVTGIPSRYWWNCADIYLRDPWTNHYVVSGHVCDISSTVIFTWTHLGPGTYNIVLRLFDNEMGLYVQYRMFSEYITAGSNTLHLDAFDPPPPPRTITVTGIPSQYIGGHGEMILNIPGVWDLLDWSWTWISGSSATFSFVVDPGTYDIFLLFEFQVDGIGDLSIHYIPSRNITAMSYTIPFTNFTRPQQTTITLTGVPDLYSSYMEIGLRHPATGSQVAWGWGGVIGPSATIILWDENTGGLFNTSGIFDASLWVHDGHNWHWVEYQASSVSITAGVDNAIPFTSFAPPEPPPPPPPGDDARSFRGGSERPERTQFGRPGTGLLRAR